MGGIVIAVESDLAKEHLVKSNNLPLCFLNNINKIIINNLVGIINIMEK